MNFGHCVHCGAVGSEDVCSDCLELLSDLGEYDDEPEPPPQPQPAPPRPVPGARPAQRFEPSAADDRELLEMRLRGSLRPLSEFRSAKGPPAWTKSKWGAAVSEWQRDPGKIQ